MTLKCGAFIWEKASRWYEVDRQLMAESCFSSYQGVIGLSFRDNPIYLGA